LGKYNISKPAQKEDAVRGVSFRKKKHGQSIGHKGREFCVSEKKTPVRFGKKVEPPKIYIKEAESLLQNKKRKKFVSLKG